MAWSVSVGCKGAPQPYCTVGALRGQHSKAEVVSDSSLALLALELKSAEEPEGIQRGRGRVGGAAEELGAATLIFLRTLVKGGQQGIAKPYIYMIM
jgi:hypothetical protein